MVGKFERSAWPILVSISGWGPLTVIWRCLCVTSAPRKTCSARNVRPHVTELDTPLVSNRLLNRSPRLACLRSETLEFGRGSNSVGTPQRECHRGEARSLSRRTGNRVARLVPYADRRTERDRELAREFPSGVDGVCHGAARSGGLETGFRRNPFADVRGAARMGSTRLLLQGAFGVMRTCPRMKLATTAVALLSSALG